MTTAARCEFSGNPCGTDTWQVGHSCTCAPCQAWLAARTKLHLDTPLEDRDVERFCELDPEYGPSALRLFGHDTVARMAREIRRRRAADVAPRIPPASTPAPAPRFVEVEPDGGSEQAIYVAIDQITEVRYTPARRISSFAIVVIATNKGAYRREFGDDERAKAFVALCTGPR